MAENNGIYPYKPSQPAAVIFLFAFGISAALHLFQMIRDRAWFYGSFTVGAIMMSLGYAARVVSAKSPADMGPYIVQSLFIILPPSLYAASIYMIYGRLVLFVNASHASLVKPAYVTKIFVTGDVLAFFLQAGGGGMMAVAGLGDVGQKIMLMGLAIQLLFFGFFLIISVVFFNRLRGSSAGLVAPQYGKHAWPALLKLMLCAAAVIILRCVFRMIEFAQGHNGYFASREVYVYLFDTMPMFCVQFMFHFIRANEVFGSKALGKLPDRESVIHLYERN
ncbi:RTA1-domain-containing protein [Periconia macrospinosa]|uniref:RTA1-domain-containing protein n=1 Tax=Periconia macrospinosa TaxID=97972 RepID=A0A2V1E0X0_9PLEO|nr:RTA1-domain-containing protein [Periconia macrospinosa]